MSSQARSLKLELTGWCLLNAAQHKTAALCIIGTFLWVFCCSHLKEKISRFAEAECGRVSNCFNIHYPLGSITGFIWAVHSELWFIVNACISATGKTIQTDKTQKIRSYSAVNVFPKITVLPGLHSLCKLGRYLKKNTALTFLHVLRHQQPHVYTKSKSKHNSQIVISEVMDRPNHYCIYYKSYLKQSNVSFKNIFYEAFMYCSRELKATELLHTLDWS